MAKIIVPVVTVLMTAGMGSMFGIMIKKVMPVFATVKR